MWKLLEPFHFTPPTWLYEEQALIPPPHTHLDPHFFRDGSISRVALEAAWAEPNARVFRERAKQGQLEHRPQSSAALALQDSDDDADAPVLTPRGTHKNDSVVEQASETKVVYAADGVRPSSEAQTKAAALSSQDLLNDLVTDTVWFYKPAGRDYGGGMILGNSIEDCLTNPNFDKKDT